MKKYIFFFFIPAFFISCSSPRKATTTGTATTSRPAAPAAAVEVRDGLSFEKAIIITEKTESAGVAAEYRWLKEHYPGYTMKMQALSFHDKKPYDLLSIVTSAGKEITIYFDISGFYGKF
jgi:hypothetical protein